MGSITGRLDASGRQFAVVASRWHDEVIARLITAALATLERYGADPARQVVVRVPGAFEVPLAARQLAATRRFAGLICLGCVLRGETAHFDYLCAEVTRALSEVALECGVPVTHGVIMADTMAQAEERSGGLVGNKGEEAALAAIEMADLLATIGN